MRRNFRRRWWEAIWNLVSGLEGINNEQEEQELQNYQMNFGE